MEPPGSPGASTGSLVGGVRVQKSPGLLPAHWWVKPSPGASASVLAGRAGSWGLVVGPKGPRASVRLIVGGVVPDTVGCRVQCVPKLVLAC